MCDLGLLVKKKKKKFVNLYIYQDSEDEELEETEEEFLDRYAKVAADLEDDMVEEGDLEDEEYELDLGKALCSSLHLQWQHIMKMHGALAFCTLSNCKNNV